MKPDDRKLAWAAVFVLAVTVLEFAIYLAFGPYHASAEVIANNTAGDNLPWWDSAAAWTAIFTCLLTVSTGGLWWITDRTMRHAQRDSARQAQDMAKSLNIASQAAKTSERHAEAMIASQRAVLHLDKPTLLALGGGGDSLDREIGPGELETVMMFCLPVQNIGNTTAIIQTVSFKTQVAENLPGWPPPYRKPEGVVGQPIKAGDMWKSLSVILINNEEMAKINAEDGLLWYYGYIRYQDFMGDTWDVGFVGKWEEVGGGYFGGPQGIVPGGPPIYAYTRKVEFKEI